MMDLHWFVNNSGLRSALRDLARFAFYGWRWCRSGRVSPLQRQMLLFVIDTPGVGGLLTFYPLLRARPAQLPIGLLVTDFIERDEGFKAMVKANADMPVLNADRLRGRMKVDAGMMKATAALARRFPRMLPTLPLFLARWHAYTSLGDDLLATSPTTRIVVFNERMLLSACISEAARRRGMDVTAVQHGNFVDNYLPVLVNRYLTWGTFHSRWIEQRAECEAVAVGSPRLDALTPLEAPALKLPTERPLHVVFFSQVGSATASPEMIATTRREILKLTANPAFRLTVKLHPLDKQQVWLAECDPVRSVEFLDGGVGLDVALRDADIVCSFYSTVLAEALLWDVAVLQLNPFPDTVGRFPDRNGIPSVASCEEFVSAVLALRDEPGALQRALMLQRSLRAGYFANLGHASAAFWEFMCAGGAAASSSVGAEIRELPVKRSALQR